MRCILASIMQWVVRVVEGPEAGEERIIGPELEVGRLATGLRLSGVLVSRRHARFSASGRTLTLEDLDSANGTVVNGERIKWLAVLASGDQIVIGGSLLEVRALRGRAMLADDRA